MLITISSRTLKPKGMINGMGTTVLQEDFHPLYQLSIEHVWKATLAYSKDLLGVAHKATHFLETVGGNLLLLVCNITPQQWRPLGVKGIRALVYMENWGKRFSDPTRYIQPEKK